MSVVPARLRETVSQTAGPYVHIGTNPNLAGIEGVYPADLGSAMLTGDTQGERIAIEGHVFDGADAPLRDALIEVWQAGADGRHGSAHGFSGWARFPVDGDSGLFRIETIRPGRVPFPDGRLQAPHLTLWIVARGINIGLHTRLYFADEKAANAEDPLLSRIDSPARRDTLIATRHEGSATHRFDIRLQGERETVFLDI